MLETQNISSIFLNALSDTRLYPLTDRHLSGLSHAAQVSVLSDRGATVIQLREKLLTPREFYKEAAEALAVGRARGVKVIINDRVDIALALNAGGVHLGQEDLPPEAARRLLGNEAIIGFSTHNLEQALLAAKMPIDYVAIGPIFATFTKHSLNSPVGLEGLRLVRAALGNIPLVAIGGITSKNGPDVVQAGADAIALIRDLWAAPQPTKTLLKRASKSH
jgi:thiamine-phosphate pyrophosphorylase